MADYDKSTQRLTFKLVYYGPALSGKTTNLVQLHDRLAPRSRGEIMMFETKQDRTLFFDLMPVGWRAPSGLLVKFKLYTVPGQVAHDSTRKAVLSRADGVCFVADSQVTQAANNAESFKSLEHNARRVGIDLDTLPMVIQFNKRDLSEIASESDLVERWAEAPWPLVMASALSGKGVNETFRLLVEQVCKKAEARLHLKDEHGVTADTITSGVLDGGISDD